MTSLTIILVVAAILQMASACKNCLVLGKAEKAMFRLHSEACSAESGAAPALVARLVAGEPVDAPVLRRHVYCVLHRCKLVGKDGKLLKNARSKLALTTAGRNATKILENCANESADLAPEDAAWHLFRCGYDRKTLLFDYMPIDRQPAAE